jgi:uncharacterized protein YwqG
MDFVKKLFENKTQEAVNDKKTQNDINPALTEALATIDKFKKTAYKPITETVEKQFNANSKFGGLPYLRNETDWPICPNCNQHKQLFLQLEMEKLPINPQNGLLQLFYCITEKSDCETELEAFFPFSAAVTCRKIEVDGDSITIEPNIKTVFEEKIIKDWKAIEDFPHFEELSDLEIEFEDEIIEKILDEELRPTLQGDKLFGFPHWIQSVEYPNDRETGTRMELIFQLDSEDNLPYMFGDSGIGHITQSPDNEQELAFAWACC